MSVYDKEVNREVIADGAAANRLEVYADYPRTFDFQEAYLCNLLEENEKKLEFDGRTLQLPVQNFEIVTIKLVR